MLPTPPKHLKLVSLDKQLKLEEEYQMDFPIGALGISFTPA
jgi:hypothetical protein